MCNRVFVRPDLVVDLDLSFDQDTEVGRWDRFGVFFDPAERSYYVADDFGGVEAAAWEYHSDREDYSGPLTYRRAAALLDEAFLYGPGRNARGQAVKYRDARAQLREHAVKHQMTARTDT